MRGVTRCGQPMSQPTPTPQSSAPQTLGLGLPGANSVHNRRPGSLASSLAEALTAPEGSSACSCLQTSSPPPNVRPRAPAPRPSLPRHHPPSSGPEPGRALSMIAQPAARVLICIPPRPARPGQATSQPSPRHWPASPRARAHAEGLAAFPKAPRTRAACLQEKSLGYQ